MAIELASQFLPYVDELFASESKKSLLTNEDFSWDGANTVKIYRITTSAMNDYGRLGAEEGSWSRYGTVEDLSATTQSLSLSKDRSFTFAIDKLDEDETKRALQAASALARQLREVVMPEVDKHVYLQMCTNAGHTPSALNLTSDNIYEQIMTAGKTLDNQEVPELGRVLLVTPDIYLLMKTNKDIVMETELGQEVRNKGVIAMLDGAAVLKVPASRLPQNFGFLLAHPSATVAPTKLEDYKIHQDPPGLSGSLVEGRVNYDAFVLENKSNALYYQVQAQASASPENPA